MKLTNRQLRQDHKFKMEENTGINLTGLSGSFALISIASVQPYLSATASLVAIFSGVCAIRYYLLKTKK